MVGLVVCIMYVLPFWRNKDIYIERRWKRNVVSRVSSVMVVIRLPISYYYYLEAF